MSRGEGAVGKMSTNNHFRFREDQRFKDIVQIKKGVGFWAEGYLNP